MTDKNKIAQVGSLILAGIALAILGAGWLMGVDDAPEVLGYIAAAGAMGGVAIPMGTKDGDGR